MFDVKKFIRLIEQKPALYDTRSKEYSHRDLRSKYWWAIGAQMYPTWSEFTREEKQVKEKELQKKWKAIRDNFVKDMRQQRKASIGQAVKKRHYIYYNHLQFLLPCLNDDHEQTADNEAEICDLKPSNSTVITNKRTNTVAPHLQFNAIVTTPQRATDTITSTCKYENTNTNTNTNTNSFSPSRTTVAVAGNNIANHHVNVIKSKKDDNSNSTIETVANTLSEMVSWHHEERQNDKFGNRAFLLSFLPLMDELTADLALEARFKISEVFRNICCANQTIRQATECLTEGLLPDASVQYSPSSIISYEDPNREN